MNVTTASILPLKVGSETERICMLVVASIVLTIGTLGKFLSKYFTLPLSVPGNSLTLVALPYVRWRYPAREFTILRNSTADLIINLSLCDFIFCLAGIGHFVHVLTIGK